MRNRVEIKTEAKDILRTARVNPLLLTLIVLAIAYILNMITNLLQTGSLFFAPQFLSAYVDAITSGDMDALMALAASMPARSLPATFFSILVSLFMTVLNGGYFIYCMGVRQGLEMPWSSLLDGLSVAGKLIWCSILMGVKIVLWTMLLWVPGFVAAYRYRFAIYNILTDSSLSASQAIRLSCQQTRGMKGDLFVLDLSFFGWKLLSLFTFGLLDIWLTPYSTLCDLAYFEEGQRRVGRSPYGAPVGEL